jgi:glycosyltransferase involved in cell wall biosynthesis
MRDNALVVELRRRGHDALLVPLYLPLILDEASAAEGAPLFYGGVNVYLQEKAPIFRRTPRWLDRLFDSSLILRLASRKAGATDPRDLGGLTVSMLRGEEGRQAKELERLVAWLTEIRPEVVHLSNALLVGMARRIKEACGAAVVCSLQGEDTFLDALPPTEGEAAWRLLKERAADIDAFIAVSRYYGEVMRGRLGLGEDRIAAVANGILLDGYEPAPAPPPDPTLGYLARMCPTKGLRTLVDAYLLLRERGQVPDLKLRVAGTMTAGDQAFVRDLRARLDAAGLEGEVAFLPNLSREEKIGFLQGLSVFSVPATYGESFGLYVIEALAAGVPVVQPRHAAFPEILEATGGGLLCPPNDPRALAESIEQLLLDPGAARAMGARARRVVLEQFSVGRMADEVIQVFEHALKAGDPRRARSAGRPPVVVGRESSNQEGHE